MVGRLVGIDTYDAWRVTLSVSAAHIRSVQAHEAHT